MAASMEKPKLSRRDQGVLDQLLMAAIVRGEIFWVRSHLAEGANANANANDNDEEQSGRSALMLALRHGRSMVEALVAAGADPNYMVEDGGDEDGDTVLHAAVLCGAEIVEALLDAGADPFKRDSSGNNALQRAVSWCGWPRQLREGAAAEAASAMIKRGMPQGILDAALRTAAAEESSGARGWIVPLALAGADIQALPNGFEEELALEERSAFEAFALKKAVPAIAKHGRTKRV